MKFSFADLAFAAHGTLQNADPETFISCISTDSRKEIPGGMFLALSGDRFDGHDFLDAALKNGAVLLCVEKRALEKLPAGAPALIVENTLTAYQKIAQFYKHSFPGLKTVALTGSSGKTSTKEMLRAIFQEAFGAEHVLATEGNTNNQIGVPFNLLRLTPEHKVCILECGTNHFGEIAPLAEIIEPDAALIVSIGRCHLENLGSLEGVASEKSNIYRFLKPGGTAVVPADCPQKDILRKAAGNRSILEAGPGGVMEAEYLGGNINGSSFLLKNNVSGEKIRVDWSLPGAHQAHNAAIASTLASVFGISLQTIAKGLANCRLPGLRMKKSEHLGAAWLNDAYNANPDSMRAALTWLSEFANPEKTLPVLGDMLETGDNAAAVHRETLEFALRSFPGARILAVGPMMTEAARQTGSSQIISFPDSDACAKAVAQYVIPGGIVFLKASHGTHLEKVEPNEL